MIRTYKGNENTFCASVLFFYFFALLWIHSFIHLLAQFLSTNYTTKQMDENRKRLIFFYAPFHFVVQVQREKQAKNAVSVCVYVSYIFFHSSLEQSLVAYIFSSPFFFQITLQSTPLHSTPHHFIPFLCPYHFILFAFSSMSYAHTLFGSTFG